jgi:uncharacterized protein (DUF885 family)
MLKAVRQWNRAATIALLVAMPAHADSSDRWDAFATTFLEELFASMPSLAVSQGRHEYDGQITDVSGAAIAKRIDTFERLATDAKAFDPTALDARPAFERELLLWYLDRQLFQLETARVPMRNPTFYFGLFSPTVYATREYAPLPERCRALTRHLGHVPELADAMRANLDQPLPRVFIERTVAFMDGMAAYLENDVPPLFAGVEDAAIQGEFAAANRQAVDAFRKTSSHYKAQLTNAPEDFALGEALFTELLRRTELVDDSLASLTARNRADLARNYAALVAACQKIDPALDLATCTARVAAKKPEGGPVARGTEQLVTLKGFVIDHDLVSIPAADEALVAEAPPYQRANLAYIERPGAFDKPGLPSIYYIAPPDPTWTAEEQRAYIPGEAALLFTSVHEVWPGHFLQGLHVRARAGSLGRVLTSTTFTEGWAHYAEELMWEAGLGNGDPEIHVAQLVNALWRNVRFESAFGMHTRGMTLAESERLFREEAFLDPGNARQQAARGAYDPSYFSYTLGKLEIIDLRDRWTAKRGGRAAWKRFHDALLANGAPPVAIAEKYLPK